MTALHAAGGGLLLAFRIPHVVQEVGSIAGFAAVVGLGILAALYFSQARDLRRLREWAGRAPERAAEGQAPASPVPGRVVATPQRTPQAIQAPVPVTSAGGGGGTPATTAQPPAEPGANGAPPAEGDTADEGEKKDADEATPADAEKAADGEKPAEDDKASDGEQSPGMPAPASAAAAAAGTGTPTPTPAPQPTASPTTTPPPRPPGSVLPPRTGAVQPVRRIPAGTAGGNAAISQAGTAPERRKRNPAYVALAVVGVLVLGAGAAIGVPKLVNGGSSTKSSKKHKKSSTTTAKATPPLATKNITVAVLNGTTIPGLAAQIGDQAQNDGFNLGTTAQVAGILEGTKAQRANSVAMYAPGHQRDARFVAKKLKISAVEPVDANSQSIAGDATVVVVVGRDQTH